LHESVVEGNSRYITARIRDQVAHDAPAAPKRAAKAVATKLGGAKLSKLASPRKRQSDAPASDGLTVFVRGYDVGTSPEEVLEYVSVVGEIKEHKFLSGDKRLFVTFTTKEDAQSAVETLHGTTIPGNERYIDVMIHEPKSGGQDGKRQKTGKGNKEKKEKGPSGPDLPRERLTEMPVTGKVLSFRGKFGWIQPDEPVEHEMASKHGGKIYVSMKDVPDGSLEKDEMVQFEIYVDASGLGAEEVGQL